MTLLLKQVSLPTTDDRREDIGPAIFAVAFDDVLHKLGRHHLISAKGEINIRGSLLRLIEEPGHLLGREGQL